MSEQVPGMASAQQLVFEHAQQARLGIVKAVGDESIAIITRLSSPEPVTDYVGNILRRTCAALGEGACAQGCGLRESLKTRSDFPKQCADGNLADALQSFGIRPEDTLMVAVTGNNIGFGDELEAYQNAGKLAVNPDGWRELPGYNAFFARHDEVPAIGCRLADCAHIEFEFTDSGGQTVIGFEHGTRPNMYGQDKYAFEIDGEPVSYTHYVMARALKHYDADPASMHIRLSSSIKAENFVKRFENEEQLENHIPGWQAAGFARNLTNPDWAPGTPTVDSNGDKDTWEADARGMIVHDITAAMQAMGVPGEQFSDDEMLDPADSEGEFSSYENRGRFKDTRDLYLVAHQSAFQK